MNKCKETMLTILNNKKIFQDLKSELSTLQVIRGKKLKSAGLGSIAALFTGGTFTTMALCEGCLGASGCLLGLSGVGLIVLGIIITLAAFAAVGFASYKILTNVEKKVTISPELAELLAKVQVLIDLMDSSSQAINCSEINLNEFERISKSIGENPMKFEENKNICERLKSDNNEIIKSIDELIAYNNSIQQSNMIVVNSN
jgi:hypothetical protein